MIEKTVYVFLIAYIPAIIVWSIFSNRKITEKRDKRSLNVRKMIDDLKLRDGKNDPIFRFSLENYEQLKKLYKKNGLLLKNLSKEWYLYNVLCYLHKDNYDYNDEKWEDWNIADPWNSLDEVNRDLATIENHLIDILDKKPSEPVFITNPKFISLNSSKQ